jgi:ABC-type glycerol-3-phosphate transport system permease component
MRGGARYSKRVGDDHLSSIEMYLRHHKWKKVVLYAVLWIWALVCAFPIYWLAVTSIKAVPDIEGLPKYLPFIDFSPSLHAWRFILLDHAENLVPTFFNSVIIASAATIITLLLSSMLLYGLSRFRHSQKIMGIDIMGAVLATRILPPVILALPLYLMASTANILDSVVTSCNGHQGDRARGSSASRRCLSFEYLFWNFDSNVESKFDGYRLHHFSDVLERIHIRHLFDI